MTVQQMQKELRRFIAQNKTILGEVDRYKFVDEGGIYTGSESVHNPHPGGYEYDIPHPETGKPMARPVNGYRFPEETMKRDYIEKDKLIYGHDENRIVKIKLYLQEYQDSLRSVIAIDGRLGAYTLRGLFAQDERLFTNPKPVQLVSRLMGFLPEKVLVLDHFAGSGTTAQSLIEMNRTYGAKRKFILVEMGDYFNTVLVPRIAKVMYTPEWKDGKPKRMATELEVERTPRLVKVLKLESYEDALHNLTTEKQLEKVKGGSEAAGDRRIVYVLDRLLEKSGSMLNWGALDRPFDYTIEILTDEGGRESPIDLVETFNALYGLRVQRFELWTDPGIEPHGLHHESETKARNKAQCLMHLADLSKQKAFKRKSMEMEGWILSPTEKLKDIPWAGKRSWENLKRDFRVLLMNQEYMPTVLNVP